MRRKSVPRTSQANDELPASRRPLRGRIVARTWACVGQSLTIFAGCRSRDRRMSVHYSVRTREHMIRNERLTSSLEGEFVVFLIGLRINSPVKVHKWWPVARAMPRMIQELCRQPELGFIHAEMWFSRTTIMVQYWRSMEQLLSYAKSKTALHLPAWRAFNKSVGTNGSVGIWHETYAASPGTYENVYVNMPPFGLGKAGTLCPASDGKQSAAGRLSVGNDAL